MTSELKLAAQTIEVSDVGDVVATPVVQDNNTGDYVREVRVFGQIEADMTSAPLLFTLRLSATTRDRIQLTAPAADF